MSFANPYVRAFLASAGWAGAVAVRLLARQGGQPGSIPTSSFVVLLLAASISALLLGTLAVRFKWLASWWAMGLAAAVGLLVVIHVMNWSGRLFREPVCREASYASPDAMLADFAAEAVRWVKKDRNADLDYSFESIKIIEEELALRAPAGRQVRAQAEGLD